MHENAPVAIRPDDSEPDEAAVNQVLKWIVSGATETDIATAVIESYPQHDGTKLLLAALGRIRESARIDSEIVAGFCIEATRDVYRRMVECGDFTGALRAIRLLRDLAR